MRLAARLMAIFFTASLLLPALIVGPVSAAAADHFTVSVSPGSGTAGDSFDVTVTARDSLNAVDDTYGGRIHFTSTDTGGSTSLPGDYTYTGSGGDNGIKTFSGVVLTTAGNQTITATDIVDTGITGTSSDVAIDPGTASQLVLEDYPDPTTAGVIHSVVVTAEDDFGNTATGYAGLVTVTASGGTTHVVPSAATALTAGEGSFSITFDTAGAARSVSASGTLGVSSDTQNGINVAPADADHLVMTTYPDPTAAGVTHTVTVSALDPFDNVDSSYAGSVTVAAVGGTTHVSPPGATPLTAGTQDFDVTYDTSGSGRTLTATGTLGVSPASQTGINVDALAADHLVLSAFPDPTVAGVGQTVTVTATDQFGNLDPTYAGTVNLSATGGITHVSPAGPQTLPGGQRTFTITFDTAGSGNSIDVTGSGGVSSDTQGGITVDPAAADRVLMSFYNDPTTAGETHPVTVTARDPFGNTDTNYAGNVTVTTGGGGTTHVSPSGATALANGVGSFDVTFDTVGVGRSILVAGTGVTSDSQLSIDVEPAAADHLALDVYPDPTVAGVLHTVTVAAEDEFNNIDTNYAGTVTVTTGGGGTTHVAPSGATTLTNGVGSFDVTFDTAGSGFSIMATGTNGAASDSQTLIDVNPAALDYITISPSTATVDPGVDRAFTVNAFDVFDNLRGDVSLAATLGIDGGGTCDNVASTCQAASSGAHTVTATYLTETATATLTINNLDPDAVDDTTISVNEDAVDYPINVLNNDSDANGDAFTITGVTQGGRGTVAVALDNLSVTYTPNAGDSGPDTFTYTIDDGSGGVDTATVTLTVVTINDAPSFTLGPDPSVLEDAGLVTVPGFAVGDPGSSFESGQILTYVVTADTNAALFAALGEPAIAGATGDLTFTPAAGASGVATITVHVVDSGPTGGSDVNFSPPQTFVVTVTAVDDAPVAVNDGVPTAYQAKQAVALVVPALTGVLANDTDVDSPHSVLAAAVDVLPTHGTLALNPDGSFTYTSSDVIYHGPDSFTYHANDGTSDSNIATVTLNVYINHVPTAVSDTVPIVSGSSYTPVAVLTNDNALNPDQGETLLINLVSNPPHGSATITGGGTGLSYRPDSGYIGTDTFTYRITDGVLTSTALVLVHVVKDTYKPVATAPVQAIRGQSLGSTTGVVYLSWTGTDKGYGVAKFELWQSVNGHSYTKVKTTTGHSATVTAKFGTTYRFRVRAIDKKGNVGAYAYGPTFRMSLYQETAASYSSPWAVVNSSAYSGGHDRLTTTAGNTATFTATGRTFAWVTAKGSMRSTADVYVDGVLKAHVNLASSTSKYKYVAYSITFAASGLHSLQVVYTGPTNKRVDVDGFVLLR